MKQLFKLRGRLAASLCDKPSICLFRGVVRASDVLIAVLMLDGRLLHAYLLARALSVLVPCSLLLLEAKVSPQLATLVSDKPLFQAAAARVNLGYLIISGSLALLVLLLAPRVAGSAGIEGDSLQEILVWMLIGQVSPILFGATRMLMQVMDRRVFYDLLTLLTTALFMIGVALLPDRSAVFIAQSLAAAQLAQSAVCALLLTQCGVWPGLTALLHKEIKLF